jgi:hypothetical protein
MGCESDNLVDCSCRHVVMCGCLRCAGRSDRYSHEQETEDTEDDGDDVMFQSFSSCSPRYSLVCQKFEVFSTILRSSHACPRLLAKYFAQFC